MQFGKSFLFFDNQLAHAVSILLNTLQDMDPRLSPPGGPVSGGEMIIFEGHLEKISDILSVRLHAHMQ